MNKLENPYRTKFLIIFWLEVQGTSTVFIHLRSRLPHSGSLHLSPPLSTSSCSTSEIAWRLYITVGGDADFLSKRALLHADHILREFPIEPQSRAWYIIQNVGIQSPKRDAKFLFEEKRSEIDIWYMRSPQPFCSFYSNWPQFFDRSPRLLFFVVLFIISAIYPKQIICSLFLRWLQTDRK